MSKIPVHYSLQVAKKVVRELEKIIPRRVAKDCSIESWSNGREQGVCINCYRVRGSNTILIAQQRCSDQIQVIHGNCVDFDISTHQPNQEIWESEKNRVEFRYDEAKKAAKYILDILNKVIDLKD